MPATENGADRQACPVVFALYIYDSGFGGYFRQVPAARAVAPAGQGRFTAKTAKSAEIWGRAVRRTRPGGGWTGTLTFGWMGGAFYGQVD